jgi:hypothetical protein
VLNVAIDLVALEDLDVERHANAQARAFDASPPQGRGSETRGRIDVAASAGILLRQGSTRVDLRPLSSRMGQAFDAGPLLRLLAGRQETGPTAP